ncbi:MAG: transcriptional repressor [Actinomycetota bacterium]|nr:transcriptional repressor [Actinomycetota bacterium]
MTGPGGAAEEHGDTLRDALRSRGMRLTPQRRRIVQALTTLEHGTPDVVATTVAADGGPALALSTIYRGLDALEELGIVAHSHLDHRSPTYHLAEHATHVHLVCLGCREVFEAPVGMAHEFAGNVREATGFDPDVTHMAIHGWCARCREARS